MQKANVAALLLLTAPLLGGCNSIFGGISSAGDDQQRDPMSELIEFADAQLAVGKSALDQGQYAKAVSAFRDARVSPQAAAAANNGLAIAYAKLGRADLAERYFRVALILAPHEQSYQANLARLYRTTLVPTDESTGREMLAAAGKVQQKDNFPPAVAKLESTTKLKGAVMVEPPTSRLTRVSANEVRIGGGARSSADTRLASDTRRPAVVVMNTTNSRNAGYPIRISLGHQQ